MEESNKNNGLNTPEGYFEGFTDKLLGKMSQSSFDFPKKDGFKVPNGYFENLDKTVISNVEVNTSKVVRLRPYRKYFYVAASIAAIVILAYGLEWQVNEKPTFEALANHDIEFYLESNEFNLDSYEIAEVFSLDELEMNDILEVNIDEENIMEYLDDTISDIEELNLEIDE